jgi:hypothetical protein
MQAHKGFKSSVLSGFLLFWTDDYECRNTIRSVFKTAQIVYNLNSRLGLKKRIGIQSRVKSKEDAYESVE